MRQITMDISGMSCGGCVSAVGKALLAIPGTRVDAIAVGSATVSYDPSRTTPGKIAQTIRDAGYQPVITDARVAANPPAATASGCCGGRAGGCHH